MRHTGHTKQAQIITIANQKGGVAKSTTANAMTTGLSFKGYKTLAVDSDPQSNLTYAMGADENKAGVYELLKGDIDPLEAVQRPKQGDIISGSLMLAGADMEFSDTGREYLLSEALEPLKAIYDYIVIDSPPTLGILTINALTAAHDLIIPMGADAFSLQGLAQLNATINKVKKHCNPSLNIAGILITRYSGRAILSQELRETIETKAARAVGTNVFESVIREGIAIKEMQTQQTSLFTVAPKSNVATDYLNFIDEYLKGGTEREQKNL
jgi:chromosome partitioning protein